MAKLPNNNKRAKQKFSPHKLKINNRVKKQSPKHKHGRGLLTPVNIRKTFVNDLAHSKSSTKSRRNKSSRQLANHKSFEMNQNQQVPDITISVDQLLNIRKKRVNRKYGRPDIDNDIKRFHQFAFEGRQTTKNKECPSSSNGEPKESINFIADDSVDATQNTSDCEIITASGSAGTVSESNVDSCESNEIGATCRENLDDVIVINDTLPDLSCIILEDEAQCDEETGDNASKQHRVEDTDGEVNNIEIIVLDDSQGEEVNNTDCDSVDDVIIVSQKRAADSYHQAAVKQKQYLDDSIIIVDDADNSKEEPRKNRVKKRMKRKPLKRLVAGRRRSMNFSTVIKKKQRQISTAKSTVSTPNDDSSKSLNVLDYLSNMLHSSAFFNSQQSLLAPQNWRPASGDVSDIRVQVSTGQSQNSASYDVNENRSMDMFQPTARVCSFNSPALGFSPSSIQSLFGNLYNAGEIRKEGLRVIIIDGSNVAMGHSNGRYFSVEGLKICIDYFLQKGHRVKAFIPQFRMKQRQNSNPDLLRHLCTTNHVVCTPSREVNGRRITSYDDRFIVQCAAVLEGIVVSCDNFRDLMFENPNLRETIEKRLLMPTWVDDMIIFPPDPLGRCGPSLDTFLKFP